MTASARFGRLPADKQQEILASARAEFSRRGFDEASTAAIARGAGISVGSLYQYFPTKQDLFLYIAHDLSAKVRDRVETLVAQPGQVLDKIEAILRIIQETSRIERVDVELYHELTAAGNRSMAGQVAQELEAYAAGAYTALIAEGQRAGEIRADVPAAMLAFLLDNVFVSLQYAHACDYFTDRCRIYLGPDGLERDEDVVAEVRAFLTSALTRSTP